MSDDIDEPLLGDPVHELIILIKEIIIFQNWWILILFQLFLIAFIILGLSNFG